MTVSVNFCFGLTSSFKIFAHCRLTELTKEMTQEVHPGYFFYLVSTSAIPLP